MFLVDAERSEEMATAHKHHAVQTMSKCFLRFRYDGMVKLLAAALTYSFDPHSHRGMIITAGLPNEAHAAAYELLQASNELWSQDGGEFCRGAVLEQVTAGLLAGRRCEVKEEQRVGPFDGKWWADGLSDSIDFVLPDGPEFYECKTNIKRIGSKHVNQYAIIHELDGLSLTAFVTLNKAATLVDWLSEFAVPVPLMAFTFEDFLAIPGGPATLQVAG
jgi:hypothetical protein